MALIFCVLSSAAAANDAMVFELRGSGGNCRGCEWISAEGTITADTPQAFLDAGSYYRGLRIVLSSRGGDLAAGMELGRLIRAAGLATQVGVTVQAGDSMWHSISSTNAECSSACAYAFLGGEVRWFEPGTDLGFHQFYDPTLLDVPPQQLSDLERLYQDARDQYVAGLIVSYLIEMEIDIRLYTLASSVGPNDPIRFITADEAALLQIDNQTDALLDWEILPFGEGLLAEATTTISNRRLRLYCSNDGNHYLTYFIPNAFASVDADEMQQIFSQYSDGRVDLKLGKATIETQVAVVAASGDNESVVVALELSEREAEQVARAPSIVPDFTELSVPTAALGVYVDAFRVDRATGSPELPLRSFRLCI